MVTHLYIYPIKSLGAVSLRESVMEQEGLRGDRRFMLVDAGGKFLDSCRNLGGSVASSGGIGGLV